jgi:hypothetical protein
MVDGKERTNVRFNVPEEEVKEQIVKPYFAKEDFFYSGIILNFEQIKKIKIYGSEIDFRNIILPDGKKALDSSMKTVDELFGKLAIQGVVNVSYRFLAGSIDNKLVPNKTKLMKGKKIFIVHGRDKEQALELQKYLKDELHQDAEMFEDVKKGSLVKQ